MTTPTMIRLHNEDWGFETNCFVCEPRNRRGLQIPFFHDAERELVVAWFEVGDDFSGAPTLVHGGVTLALLDEAMAWACIAIGHQWAVTTETTTRFHRAVRVGSSYRVEGRVVGRDDATMRAVAQVLDARDVVRADAEAVFTTLGEAQATRLAGGALDDEHRSYFRE